MKKVLLASTAVAGIAALSAQASAAEAPTLSITGGMEYQYHFYDNDDKIADTKSGNDIKMDNVSSQIIFNAKGIADNGLEYGALFDFRMNITNDESYLYVADSWGRIHFGDDDGATANLMYGAEAALSGTGGFDGNGDDYFFQNDVSAVTSPSTLGSSDDSSKLVYYTPNFSGFSGAISYSPNGGFTTDKTDDDEREDIVEIAAQYDGTFDAITVGLVAGWRGASAVKTNDEDVSTWEIGGKVGFGGFTAALGYGDNGDSLCDKTVNGCDAGYYWDIGLGYSAGPFKVGIGYFASEADQSAGVTDEVEFWTLGGTYTVAQGLNAFAEYNDATYTNGAKTGDDKEAENSSFIVGTRLSF